MQEKRTEILEEVAILFSDILGSSSYFNNFGDAAGVDMVENYNSLLSPIINEHEGHIIKTLGDSIMARFSNPLEATKCAIRMQKKIAYYNNSRPSEHHIHMRIGINYGKGIMEENDIFGDLVNIASKITQIAQANQIMLSEEVYEHIKDQDYMYFNLAGSVEYTQSPKAINVFLLTWDDDFDFSPCGQTHLLVKPLYGYGEILEAVYRKTSKHPEKSRSSEDFLYYIFESTEEGLLIAKEVSDEFESNAKVVVCSSTDIDGGESAWQAPNIDWEMIQPGVIYICNTTNKLLQHTSLTKELTLIPSAINGVFRLQWASEEESEDLFKYHEIFVAGPNNRCFYCGSRGHHISKCPSKNIGIKSNNLNRLGYLSFGKINEAASRGFDAILNHMDEYLTGELQPDNDPGATILFAFFELTREFQLPFLRQVWSSKGDSWAGIRYSPQIETAGSLLLGEDCIRVSKLQEAESMILAYMRQNPEDYRPYTANAFLNIEREDFARALQCLHQALGKSETDLEVIYIDLLLARVYEITREYEQATSYVKDALRIDPYCPEARYQNAVLHIKMGYISQGEEIIRELIREDRVFISKSLIDPELANGRGTINRFLAKVFKEAKDETVTICAQALEHMELARDWLDDDNSKIEESEGMYSRIKECISSESFFGYMDASDLSKKLVLQIKRDIRQNQRDIESSLLGARRRLGLFHEFYAGYPYKHMYQDFGRLLVENIKRCKLALSLINQDALEKYREARASQKDVSNDLRVMEELKGRMEFVRRAVFAIRSFSKRMAVFESLTLIVAFILLPLVHFYLTDVSPGREIFQTNDIAVYQRPIFYIGSLVSFVEAIRSSLVHFNSQNVA